MNRSGLHKLAGMVLLLCASFAARAVVTIPVTGPSPVCRDSAGIYSAPRAAGLTYIWSTSPQGNVSSTSVFTTTTTASVIWVGSGAATVTVKGYDLNNTLQEQGTLNVTVLPRPAPYITMDVRVGCQNLEIDTPRENGHPQAPQPLKDDDGCIKVCEYSTVIYTANGAVGSTFTWNVSGASSFTPSGPTCTVVWDAAGAGSITVTERTTNGCVGTKTICLEKINAPRARFFALPDSTLNVITVCRNQQIVFVDRSTAGLGSPLVSWFWDFGDGNTFTASSGAPQTHAYALDGLYTVTLTVTNQCNCKSTYQMRVRVLRDEGVKIECPSVVCEGAKATYKVGVNCSSYAWSIIGGTILSGQGTASVEVVWDNVDASGFGYLTFDATPCHILCAAPTTIKVPVIKAHGDIEGPAVACPNKTYLYRLPQWPTTDFTWSLVTSTGATISLTDQRNEVLVNTSGAGGIILKCTYYNTLLKCGGVATFPIQVQPPVSVAGPLKVCINSTSNTYSLSGGTLGTWVLTTPNGSPISGPTSSNSWTPTVFNQAGNYTLAVSGLFCAPDPLIITVKPLPPAPDSLLGPTTACAGIPVEYKAKNPMAGTVFAWSINTGTLNAANGGTTYATFNPTPSPYTITVRREWSDLQGCFSAPISLTVNPPVVNPNVSGSTTPCGSTTQPYNTGGYTDAETYEWSVWPSTLGSPSPVTGMPGINVTWNNPSGASQNGYVIVKVRKCGIFVVDSLPVTVYATPSISINASPNPVCRGQAINFSLNSTPALSSYTSIAWDFGTGTGSGPAPSYTYTAPNPSNATYNVSVVVVSPNGCLVNATANTVVTVKPAPVANITPVGPFFFCDTTNINGITLTATAQSGFGGPIASYTWIKNGVTIPGATSATYSPTSTGNYAVIVANASPNSCAATTNTVLVGYDCPDTCLFNTLPVVTNNVSLTSCGTISGQGTWQTGSVGQGWSYPPQATPTITYGPGNVSNASFSFTQAGLYSLTFWSRHVSLTGDTCTIDSTRHVLVPFIAGLKTSVTCTGGVYQVKLLDNSNYYPGIALNYAYYINGSSTPAYSGTNTSYTAMGLAAGATHNFTLIISDGLHPACTTTASVTLPAYPMALFNASRTTACIKDAVINFTNASTPSVGSLSHAWDFGDFSSNNLPSPSKVYNSLTPAFKLVTLTVTNEYGCTDGAAVQIHVVPDSLDGQLSQSPAYPCEGNPVTLTYAPTTFSGTYPTAYSWFFNQNPLLSTTTPSINVYDPGGYYLTGSNFVGCTHTTDVLALNIKQVPDPVISGDSTQCFGVDFTLDGYVGGTGYTYEWRRNGPVVQSGPLATLTQTGLAIGTYTYLLTVYAPNPPAGTCQKTSQSFTLTVNGIPAPPTINAPVPINCASYTIELSASHSQPGTFNWSNGMAGTPIQVQSGGDYRVWFTDGNGCVSHANQLVPRDPKSYLWIFPEGCYAFCKKDMPFHLIGPRAVFDRWDWLFNGSPDLTGFNTLVSDYYGYGSGTYNLYLRNSLCDATSNDMVVDQLPDDMCRREPCHFDVKVKGVEVKYSEYGCNRYLILDFVNPYPNAISYTITTTSGSFAPGAGVVSPGGTGPFTYQFLPAPGFTNGPILVTMTFDLGDGRHCTAEFWVNMPECNGTPFRNSNAGNGSGSDGRNNPAVRIAEGAKLLVAPNPASGSTAITYHFSAVARNQSIAVYDVAGRLMSSHPVNSADGTWTLPLDRFAPGMYTVVMRADGKVVLTSKLAVTR